MRRLVLVVLSLAFVAALGEAALRLRGGWAGGRGFGGEGPVVLCVGDSLTRGRPDPENYPAELQRLLRSRTGKPYRVLNLGVPGVTTTQLRARFERYLDFYRPAVVLLWAGIDNGWRHPETKNPRTLPARLVDHSWLLRELRATFAPETSGGWGYRRAGIEAIDWIGPYAIWRVDFGGVEEEISTVFGEVVPPAEVGVTVRADLGAMMRAARERGVPTYLVKYAFFGETYRAVNQAIIGVSSELGVPYVDSTNAATKLTQRMPKERIFDDFMHPLPALYWQIAEEVYEVLAAEGMVAPASSAVTRRSRGREAAAALPPSARARPARHPPASARSRP
jgi:lysophospholipase L1-like esterase